MGNEHDAFVGTWKLVAAESRFGQHHQPSEGTMRFVRDVDGYVMYVEGISNGEVIREQPLKFYLDGREHPLLGAPRLCAASTRVDGNTIRVVARRGNESLGEGIYSVSPDGCNLTTTLSGVDAEQRSFQSTVVWRRVEGQ